MPDTLPQTDGPHRPLHRPLPIMMEAPAPRATRLLSCIRSTAGAGHDASCHARGSCSKGLAGSSSARALGAPRAARPPSLHPPRCARALISLGRRPAGSILCADRASRPSHDRPTSRPSTAARASSAIRCSPHVPRSGRAGERGALSASLPVRSQDGAVARRGARAATSMACASCTGPIAEILAGP